MIMNAGAGPGASGHLRPPGARLTRGHGCGEVFPSIDGRAGKPVRIRRGPATVTGERPARTPPPRRGGKAEGSANPGARKLRPPILRPGAWLPRGRPRLMMPSAGIVLISASDTDLLAAQAAQVAQARSGEPGSTSWRLANPARTAPADVPALLDGAFCVVVRLLGGRRSWPEGLDAVLASGLPTVVLSGEPSPDAELMSLSTVPAGVATEALAYLREGGPANLAELARFLSDTILLTGEGFEPPEVLPAYGAHPGRPRQPGR